MNGFVIILLVIVIIMSLILAVSFYAYYEVFYVKKKKLINIAKLENGYFTDEESDKILTLINEFKNDEFEEVKINSFDGVKLYARYYEYNKNAPLQIMFHGYRSEGFRDFAGGMKLAKQLKHNVLMVEQRGHGQCKTCTTTLGILEKYDCLYWVKYAVERFGVDVKIILVGVSMGASTILMASNLNLPQNVVGIIADSPYSTPYDIVLKVMKERKIPNNLALPFVMLGALLYGRFEFDKKGAIDSVKENKIPVLIFHGDADSFVPSYMSKEIYYNCSSKKELYIFEGADHCRNFLVDEEKYTNHINEFIKKIL